jgi:hypothetical protein
MEIPMGTGINSTKLRMICAQKLLFDEFDNIWNFVPTDSCLWTESESKREFIDTLPILLISESEVREEYRFVTTAGSDSGVSENGVAKNAKYEHVKLTFPFKILSNRRW